MEYVQASNPSVYLISVLIIYLHKMKNVYLHGEFFIHYVTF